MNKGNCGKTSWQMPSTVVRSIESTQTYLDSCGERDLDLDLEREAERCPLRSADLRDADRSLREWLEADLERDLERLRSLRDVDNARHKTVVYLFSYI